MSKPIAMTLFAALLSLGASLVAAPSPAQAQSANVRCKVKPDFPSTWCCRTCVAWNKGAPGTFVGSCKQYRYEQGKCTGVSGVH
jgi:hypothetical protein